MDTPDRFYQKNAGAGAGHLDIKPQENQTLEQSVTNGHVQPQPQQQQQYSNGNGKKIGISTMSKAEIRKSNKPIMEKKRRARINNCLEQLKKILLENVNKDSAQHSKLEKADILEMTVKHLQQIQRRQLILAVSLDRSVLEKFRTGFAECAAEVRNFIGQMDDLEPGLKQRLTSHLESSVTKIQRTTPMNLANVLESKPAQWNANLLQLPMNEPLNTPLLDDLNNNQRMHMDLIPTRLPTGELAFVMPNSSNMPFPSSSSAGMSSRLASNTSTPRFSAFSVVNGNQSRHTTKSAPTSPPLSPIASDQRLPQTPPSTLSLFHTAFSNSLANRSSPFASTSRYDSGYKSDSSLNMSEIIYKPSVPQQSYTELLKSKPVNTMQGIAITPGPHSAESSLNCSFRDSPCSSNSERILGHVKEEHEKEGSMWRPW